VDHGSVVTQKQFVVQDDANVWRSVLGMRVSDCGSGAIVDSQGRMVGIFT
jgi:predicted transcriptional regulator